MAKKSKSAGMKQYEDRRNGFESIDYKNDRTYITRREKYRALFLSQFIVEHPQLDSRATRYFLTKLFDSGSVACYRIPHTDIPAFAPYSCNSYDRYSYPAKIKLVKERAEAPDRLVPSRFLPVNEEGGAVLAYVNLDYLMRPAVIVDDYAKKLADVDMAINTNLQLQKMPFLVLGTGKNNEQRKQVLAAIMANRPAVFRKATDLNSITSLRTDSPYIIDKLTQYKNNLDSEVKTLLGIDNLNTDTKSQYINDSETNANNEEISLAKIGFYEALKDFQKNAKKYLGFDFDIRLRTDRNTQGRKEEDDGSRDSSDSGDAIPEPSRS